jgi:hypothetical protein
MLTNKQQGALLLFSTGVAIVALIVLLDMFGVLCIK